MPAHSVSCVQDFLGMFGLGSCAPLFQSEDLHTLQVYIYIYMCVYP